MARCQRCNKFMFRRSASGYCGNCETIVAQEEEERRRKAEEERRRKEEEERRRKEEVERRRKEEEEEERRRKAEEERKRRAEEERKRKEEEERQRMRERSRPETVYRFIDNSSSDVFAKWLQADDFSRDESNEMVYMVLSMYTSDAEKEIMNGLGLSNAQLRSIDWKSHVRKSPSIRAKAQRIPPPFIKVPIRDLY